MNQTNNKPQPSQVDIVLASYLLEADRLIHTIESNMFARLQPRFKNYSTYIDTLNKKPNHKLIGATNTGVVLDISKHSRPFEEILTCANMAACCELFKGVRIKLKDFNKDEFKAFVSDFIVSNGNHLMGQFFDKLNSADAIRTMETLRLLNLLPLATHKMKQLSFGVGNANKDLRSIHLIPSINKNEANLIALNSPPESFDFNVQLQKPENVILVDNHPEAKAYFDKLNKDHNGTVNAVNKDAYQLLDDLAKEITSGTALPRDLLVSLRFDHLMLPNVDLFLDLAGKVIADEAHLIMSIGAGHTDDEFRGRIKTINELYNSLIKRKLKPVRIKLYRGKSVKEKRERPGLGAPQYATYEIIYCKLKKSNM